MAKNDVNLKFSLIDGVSKGLTSIAKNVGSVSDALTSVKGLAIQAAAAFSLLKLGGAFTAGVASAATFEQSLDKISAKTGVTGDALDSLGASIRRISQDASKTGDQGAAAFERLTAEGQSAAEALKNLPTALDFATASSQGTAEAVGSLSDNLDAFGLGADKFSQAADVITAGALKGGVGVADLQKALQQVGPTARDLGLSLEQTTATLATLAQNGLEGGRAGKALAAVFDQLRDPFSKFREELAKIGITSGDFNVVLSQLGAGGKKTEAALNALGLNGTAAIKALTANGGAQLAALTGQLANVEGQTSKTAATINAGLIASFTRLKESADSALSAFLEPVLGPLTEEFNALASSINEFVASPAFEDLRTKFRDAFVEGIAAVKAFVAEFDFSQAGKSLGDFLSGAKQNLASFKEVTGQIAAAVRLAGDGISIFFNTLKTIVSGAVLAVTRSLNSMLSAFDAIASRTEGLRNALGAIGDAAEDQASKGLVALEASARDAGKQIEIIAEASTSATAELSKSVPVLQRISEEEFRVAQNAQILADSEAAAAETASKFAQEHDAAATSLGKFGDAAKLASENAQITADISSKSAASFKQVQEGIAEEISARKRQTGAVRELSEAVDEAAEAQQKFQAAVTADAGYSEAVFAALGARIDAIAPKIAELQGVSESSIRDGVNRDTLGATNGFVGMNTALEKLEETFANLGGDKALERVRKTAQDLARAFEEMGQRAEEAREKIAGEASSLEEELLALRGDERAQEDARFKRVIENLQEQARIAGGTGAAELARAIAAAEEIHRLKLKQIQDEARARVDAETGADAEIKAVRSGATGALGGSPFGGGGQGQTPGRPPASPAIAGSTVNISGPLVVTGGRAGVREFARVLKDELDGISRNSI